MAKTISLAPCSRGNKVVIADTVKRTRGVLKGSACLINKGKNGNPVVIAEGPETGASISSALPDANVYITLGNYHNAEQLNWLAEKHNTDTILLAADNDGINSKSRIEETANKVAETLQSKGLKTFKVKPELEGKEKLDFNDILQVKGPEPIIKLFENTNPLSISNTENHSLSKSINQPKYHSRGIRI